MMRVGMVMMAATAVLALTACDDGSDPGTSSSTGPSSSSGSKATGEGPCNAASECANDVCVALIDGNHPPAYCSESCTSGSCPSGFYCDQSTFGLVGLSFCRYGATEPATPEPPAEPPRLPCRTDADCEGNAVCATYEGQTDCTLPCNSEPECTPPSLGGVTLDLATCAPDQTPGEDRTVCLPDPACFPSAMSCISGLPGIPGF